MIPLKWEGCPPPPPPPPLTSVCGGWKGSYDVCRGKWERCPPPLTSVEDGREAMMYVEDGREAMIYVEDGREAMMYE